MVNPWEDEKKYRADKNDQLFVLARKGADLLKLKNKHIVDHHRLNDYGNVNDDNKVNEIEEHSDEGSFTKKPKHIVMVGWKSYAPAIIYYLFYSLKFLPYSKIKLTIVSSAPETVKKEIDNFLGSIHFNDENLKHEIEVHTQFIKGNPKEQADLKQASIEDADTVIILSEESEGQHGENHSIAGLKYLDNSDLQTLLKAVTLSTLFERLYGKANVRSYEDQVYMITEVVQNEIKHSLLDNDVNEVVNRSDIATGIILQSAVNHGVSKLLDNLLTYSNESNEFYLIDLRNKAYRPLVGKNFDTLLLLLRKYEILLWGIKITFYDNNREIIDQERLDKQLGEDKHFNGINKKLIATSEKKQHWRYKWKWKRGDFLQRRLIINPYSNAENAYITREDDQLFVIARSGEYIKKMRE